MIIDKRKVSGEEMIVRVEVEEGVGVAVWKIKKEVVPKMTTEDDLVKKEGGRRRGKVPSLLDGGALHIHPHHHLLHLHLGHVLEIETERGRRTQTKDQRRVRSATGARNVMRLLHHHRRRLVMTEIENDERSKRKDTSQEVATRVMFVPKAMLSVNNQNESITIHLYKLILLRRQHPQSLVKVVQTQPMYLRHQLQLSPEHP